MISYILYSILFLGFSFFLLISYKWEILEYLAAYGRQERGIVPFSYNYLVLGEVPPKRDITVWELCSLLFEPLSPEKAEEQRKIDRQRVVENRTKVVEKKAVARLLRNISESTIDDAWESVDYDNYCTPDFRLLPTEKIEKPRDPKED